jgi:hypothetical protein
MYSRRRTRHTRGKVDNSSSSISVPVVTGDPSLWFSNQSGDEASSTWHDISGNGNNGTANNAGACLANYYFRGGNLGSGTDDFVTTAYAGNIITATQPWSLEGWVIRDPADPGQVTIWGCRRTTPNGGWLDRENAHVTGPVDFDTYTAGGFLQIPDVIPDILLEGWSHISLTWEPNTTPGTHGTIRHYYNGAISDTSSCANFDNGDIFEIAGSTYNRWTGYIDTVRVFSRTLSPDEILRDYQAGLTAHQ